MEAFKKNDMTYVLTNHSGSWVEYILDVGRGPVIAII